jgi:hypothetical protein
VVVAVLVVPLYAYHGQVAVPVLVHEVPAVAAPAVRVGGTLVPAQHTARKVHFFVVNMVPTASVQTTAGVAGELGSALQSAASLLWQAACSVWCCEAACAAAAVKFLSKLGPAQCRAEWRNCYMAAKLEIGCKLLMPTAAAAVSWLRWLQIWPAQVRH